MQEFTLVTFICTGASFIWFMFSTYNYVTLPASDPQKYSSKNARNTAAMFAMFFLLLSIGLDLILASHSIKNTQTIDCAKSQEIALADVQYPIILHESNMGVSLEYSKVTITNQGEVPEVITVSNVNIMTQEETADHEHIKKKALDSTGINDYYTVTTKSDKNTLAVTTCTVPTDSIKNLKDYRLGIGYLSTMTRSINIYTITVTGDKLPEK